MANRVIEVLRGNDWVVCQIKDLKIGDRFRATEPDGIRWKYKDSEIFIAECNAFEEDGHWKVKIGILEKIGEIHRNSGNET